MALAPLANSRVIWRFRFGKAPYKARQRFEDTYRSIIERVALKAADDTFDDAKAALETRIAEDVKNELTRLVSTYKAFITGAPGTSSKPNGSLTTAIPGGPSQPIATAIPDWAPRSAKYLAFKRRSQGSIVWFDTSGSRYIKSVHGRKVPKSRPGLGGDLRKWASVDNWTNDFGPISVSFNKRNDVESQVDATFQPYSGKKLQLRVGQIVVRAFGRITPDMLPALAANPAGSLPSYTRDGNPDLIDLIGDEKIRYRLGQRSSSKEGPRRYRPTLEPFLGFFLTKSIPYAIAARIAKSNFGNLRSGTVR